jgi:hypothetical protein
LCAAQLPTLAYRLRRLAICCAIANKKCCNATKMIDMVAALVLHDDVSFANESCLW